MEGYMALPAWGTAATGEEKERGWALNQPLRGFPVVDIKLLRVSVSPWSPCPVYCPTPLTWPPGPQVSDWRLWASRPCRSLLR